MIHVGETKGPIESVVARLEKASVENGFGVLGIHDLKEKMAAKGVDFACECRVMEVCNPHKAKEVLEENMSISTALPCRISIYPEGDRVKVATIRPTMLLNLFDSPELQIVAREVEDTLVRIIDTACA
ncbi:MAG: DUF302 domain-containing protein [Sedimentisphaerales bacterium]|nr:DUF302 domain-containing protein [Sedimentisphaerales bacterium]